MNDTFNSNRRINRKRRYFSCAGILLTLLFGANAGTAAAVSAATKPTVSASSADKTETEKAQKILSVMKEELDRSFSALKQSNPPVYFMAYRVTTTDDIDVSAAKGATLQLAPVKRSGHIQIEVRVGSPQLDNFHPGAGGGFMSHQRFVGMNVVPLDGDVTGAVLRRNLWLETEKAYRSALERYGRVVAHKGLANEEDPCADFSQEKPTQLIEMKPLAALKIQPLEQQAKQLSSIYKKYPSLESTSVYEHARCTHRYIVNTEGTAIADSSEFASFATNASTTAKDGDKIHRAETLYFRNEPEALASQKRLEDLTNDVASQCTALAAAPLAEPFCGPAMLEGSAAAVLFHEVLGHRLEASRYRDLSDGKTFAKMLNAQILPPFISVADKPLQESLSGTNLVGHYDVDDEGVKASDVTLVKDGKLVNFLLNRTPVLTFANSNGHGRCDGYEGHFPKSRMANLIVESSKTVPQAELRRQLIAEAKKQGKPYGLLIERVESGNTHTSSYIGQLFQVYPSVVKRVYVDGRPDELVRGVRIVGTPLSALQRIVQTGDKTEVFNGSCGAESGWVAQANCSPSILIDYLETERQPPVKGVSRVLPAPDEDKTTDAH